MQLFKIVLFSVFIFMLLNETYTSGSNSSLELSEQSEEDTTNEKSNEDNEENDSSSKSSSKKKKAESSSKNKNGDSKLKKTLDVANSVIKCTKKVSNDQLDNIKEGVNKVTSATSTCFNSCRDVCDVCGDMCCGMCD
ncbi:uncharacterized protein LOC126895545 isoform X1 [Daktulosphaira vitifoliae]|uniref:uncharacterized protein LOC126895545 isoform X1 n=1 Tax=Daktulosphaira vitifoliae TaxID=58002 RepID=UPI0021A9D6A1|nr:uncharacterized protein LOC126895545 isoform X1 [Daktulosphaira vitifoliae]XP_050523482.1 uncharacterized protein LOC126895545 isoform X1 [Daktulosphaira vitifoliae]XP_050523483.1 uncharacterized protein LOC126895545 isoform X1 [Daktulosphaira vitifoliae]